MRALILRELYLWHALLRGQQEDELGCEPSLNLKLSSAAPYPNSLCRSLLLLPISTRILTIWYQIHLPILDPPSPPHSHYTRFQKRSGVMDPNTKLILDEMNKRFTELDTKLEQRLIESESTHDAHLSILEDKAAAFEEGKPHADAVSATFSDWKPFLEASVEDLKLEVTKIHKAWDRLALDRSGSGQGILEHPSSASARPPAGSTADSLSGHRVDHNHRDLSLGRFLPILMSRSRACYRMATLSRDRTSPR